MIRSMIRKSLIVVSLAIGAAVAAHGSVGAQPGPDDDPNYNHPMWIYANPATVSRQVATDPQLDPWFDAGEQTGGR